jgi:heme exporter protein CcmD
MNLSQIFDMGGYGIYVWPAYGITMIVFAINVFIALNEKKHIKKIMKRYLLQTRTHHES